MRRLLPLILLLAPACYAQTNVPIVNGVATADVGQATKFKITVNAAMQLVLASSTTPAPYPGETVNVVFQENATGGFTVTFAANIGAGCVVATGATVITQCSFTYDSTANSWNVGGGSGGGVSSTPTGNLAGFIQAVQCAATGTSVACPSLSVTSGDMLFIGGGTAAGPGASSVTDSLGNTFTQVAGSSGGAFYALVNASGSDTVTLNFASSQAAFYALGEYSGVSTPITVDQTCFSSATNSSFITTSCANVTTSANELLIGIGKNNGTGVWSTFPPYTLRTASNAVNALEDAFQPATSSVAAIANETGVVNVFGFVSFNALPRSNPSLYAAVTQGACSGQNCFQVKAGLGFGGPADTREVLDASWSSSGTTVTSAGAANFSPFQNGMKCWGTPQSQQAGPSAPGTFTYSTPLTGSCSPSGSLIGAPGAGTGMFTWGHDDTAVLVAATAGMYAQPKCGAIQLPAARMMLAQGLSFTGSVAVDCNVSILGQGFASVIELEPGFSFSAVTSSIGTIAAGPFWAAAATTLYSQFTITGENQSLSGISTSPASALLTIGPGAYATGVNLTNWATSASNSPRGINITGGAAFGLGTAATNWGDGNIWPSSTYAICYACGGNATFKQAGNGVAYDFSGTYGGTYTTGSGAEQHFFGTTSLANNGPFGSSSCDHNGGELVFADGAKFGFGTPGSGGVGFEFNNLGSGAQCTLSAQDTIFNGGASGSAILSGAAGVGNFIDRGRNTFNGPLSFSGTYTNLTSLNVRGACTGTATSSSTLGLYGTGPNQTTTTCTSTTIGSGIVMTKAYTIYELLVTATHAGVSASSGAVTVLKNGSAQTMTCTIGTGTACQDGAVAHQVTGSAGDLISIQFTTQAAEVLAGIQASLIIE